MRKRRSEKMYCCQADVQLIGEDAPKTRYVRFRPHGMDKGYSVWTENVLEAKFSLYEGPAWALSIKYKAYNARTVVYQRNDSVLNAQKEMS